jgi:hypothetical protein
LGNWVNRYRREHTAQETPLTLNERARLRELEREARELKMENDQPGLLRGLLATDPYRDHCPLIGGAKARWGKHSGGLR